MDQLFKNKYRIKSTRLKSWDYSSTGVYFITICTKNRECCLGQIINEKMILSEIGEIVLNEWIKTERIRGNVKIGEWVVMPNHLHGIVIIENDDMPPVETHSYASLQTLQTLQTFHENKFGLQRRNLAAIIRGFKGATTKQIRSIGFTNFAWQQGYYEHIIRNKYELNRICEYIINNPLKWQLDSTSRALH